MYAVMQNAVEIEKFAIYALVWFGLVWIGNKIGSSVVVRIHF
jgi:hypothetical protein